MHRQQFQYRGVPGGRRGRHQPQRHGGLDSTARHGLLWVPHNSKVRIRLVKGVNQLHDRINLSQTCVLKLLWKLKVCSLDVLWAKLGHARCLHQYWEYIIIKNVILDCIACLCVSVTNFVPHCYFKVLVYHVNCW